VRNWLDGLKWDGGPRIDNWLVTYAGAEDTPFNRAVGRIFLIAGVRRVRQPGCKFDTMLVLESPQGRNKSRSLGALATRPEWFTDNLSLAAEGKELIEQTSGVWLVEFADLSGIGRRDVNHVKSLLSRREDRARAAYARRSQRVPRQFITAGTTNDAQYLIDDENRRFWPVAVEGFDFAAIERAAPQLWAEAAVYEAAGEPITLAEELWQAAAEAQAARRVNNPLLDKLAERLGDAPGWIKGADVWAALDLPIEKQMGLARAVGQAMRELGFERVRLKGRHPSEKGRRDQYLYQRGDGDTRLII